MSDAGMAPLRTAMWLVLLAAAGTFALTMGTRQTCGLILAIGVLSAGGAGMAGPAVLMAATTRLIPLERRGLAEAALERRLLASPRPSDTYAQADYRRIHQELARKGVTLEQLSANG